MATITELKTALKEKYNFDAEGEQTAGEFLTALIERTQANLDRQQARVDEMKAQIGTDAKDVLKKEAIVWINDKVEAQDIIDSADVTL